MSFKRRVGIWLGSIAVGLTIGIMISVFDLDSDLVLKYYVGIGFAIIAGCYLYNVLYIRKYARKIQECATILNEQRPQEYLDRLNEIYEKLSRAKHGNKYLKSLVGINLCAGYSDLHQYKEALRALVTNDSKYIKGINRVIYNLNLSYCYFKLGENEMGQKVYLDHQAEFEKLKDTEMLGGNIAALDVMYLISKQEYELADARLEEARVRWKKARIQAGYEELKKEIRV